MPEIFKKPVSLTELFYDLVFVYAVSQITEIFEPMREHELTWMTVAVYLGVFISFIGSWNIQTVYFNRFGEHNFKDIILMSMVQMPILLFMARYANPHSFEDFTYFSVGLALLSLVHIIQYVWVALTSKDAAAVSVSTLFSWMLGLRLAGIIAGILVSVFVSGMAGFAIVVASVVIFLLYPLLFMPRMGSYPVNVPHLIERLQLLTIITIGELIVGQARYFKFPQLSLVSYGSFVVIVAVFMFYIVEFDHLIDEAMDGAKASIMIYFHYLIWLGINLITVAYDFIDTSDPISAHLILTLGLVMFYAGVLLHAPLHRGTRRMAAKDLVPVLTLVTVGPLASLFVLDSTYGYLMVTLVYTFGAMAYFMYFNLSRRARNIEDDIEIE